MRKVKQAVKKVEEAQQIVLKAQQEIDDKLKKLEEAKQLALEEDKAEKENIENIKIQIEELSKSNSLFCGVILTKDDILQLIKMAMEVQDNIKIPFALYIEETE